MWEYILPSHLCMYILYILFLICESTVIQWYFWSQIGTNLTGGRTSIDDNNYNAKVAIMWLHYKYQRWTKKVPVRRTGYILSLNSLYTWDILGEVEVERGERCDKNICIESQSDLL